MTRKYHNKSFTICRLLLITGIILLSASSCKKFLASYSQNSSFLQTAADLEELLLGQGYNIYIPPVWVHQLDDDAERNPTTNAMANTPTYRYFGLTFWQQTPFMNNLGQIFQEEFYHSLYRSISALNTILHDIPAMRNNGEPADVLQRISGESHFMRAWNYFILANLYGKPYSVTTAATDYSVPLKTNPAVEDKNFARNTVKELFDLILSDLHESEKELEKVGQRGGIRPELVTVQALLSRVYLYMSDYEKAVAYSDKVINTRRHQLIDLNSFPQGRTFLSKTSPEFIFCFPSTGSSDIAGTMLTSSFSMAADNYMVSPDLKESYAQNDLRLPVFFERTPASEFLYRKTGMTHDMKDEYVIRLPEILLNKAEALAALGRNEEAINTIQELRKKRFKPEHLTTITETGAGLIQFIREERRRELCFEWHRWFDLRRYAVNKDLPFEKSIRHTSYAYGPSGRYVEGYYELKPYQQDKAAYVIPVPQNEIEFNQGVLKNEERPQRPLIK